MHTQYCLQFPILQNLYVSEEERPSTFHLLLIQCASLYRYLNSIHITWKFLEGKHPIHFRPFLLYSADKYENNIS